MMAVGHPGAHVEDHAEPHHHRDHSDHSDHRDHRDKD
jgi:hypothetical protein